MIAELLGVITTGIAIVEGVTRILKNLDDLDHTERSTTLSTSINSIGERVTAVEKELEAFSHNSGEETRLGEAYSTLIRALQEDDNYASYIKIIPTSYGTWKIVRRKKRKPTILRDSEGEYSSTAMFCA